ncbi:MAG: hypothetical protein CVU38_02225 [Chloroflexi bacterium HGW-Chloroflexi-1]|nr:MAG: hypothetical protein CVU38_02225 [Chloroflexi bacterium HGW-Chloroflexi-1]
MKNNGLVLILWADYFDEMAATAFVTILRQMGMRVKLVSPTHNRIVGANGLVLAPDVTLDQVIPLADQVIAVIVPGKASAVRRLDDDPRVHELLCQIDDNHAVFVTNADAAPELVLLLGRQGTSQAVATYTDSLAAVELAQQLAEKLTTSAG